ncbi:probable disease resistance protein At4g27220 [Eucalyptus grandis]|uniref:probable disease resistance protein At4g27220 n=1 Tax=Eucalyptus grandis TaxID=71139 RepID=UPI00192E8C4A|nr:probable disease resistance protein At4g27220 [Eucalyptus grandis]
MSTECAIPIGWDVLKCLVAPLKRGFSYVMSSKSYADNLRKEVGNLEYEAERVHNAAEVAQNNLQSIYRWVPDFLLSAETALVEAGDLLGEPEKASKTCCHGTLPDPNCRYQFSRKAKHKTDDIKNLILENSNKEISCTGPAPGNVAALIPAGTKDKDVVQSTTTTASTSSVDFESRALMIRNIMDALVDNRYSVVGVHGMGGVGKSTLLVDVEKRIREENSFDWVAKADVSQNPDVKKIQEDIAHWLGLSDIKKEDNVSLRAKLLRERLEDLERKKNKVLIILDNLWERLDLKDVGIPCGLDNKVIGCKLLLTARDERVLRREMRCDNAFFLGRLENEEAKRLFETMVGGKVQVELEPLVEEALHVCAGLPFLILAISKLFIDTSYSECKYALKQIWNEETGEVINKTLRVSYDRIKCKEAKTLLQLCAVYGVSKPSFESLVRYSMGLGLFGENSSMEDARQRLSLLIHTLQASSFLLKNGENDGFKIHDLVRGFVTSIISRDHPLLILKDKDKAVTELTKDKLKSCKAICFSYIDLEELPKGLDCPELQIFMLFTNNRSLEVPDSYFNSMKNLMVLNLSGIHLSRSPSLFQFLENLHTLCLDHSSLEDVAILGELKGLQILSLKNSKIQQLSKEIGQLVELRLLDLNYCSNLQIIEPGVLGSLIKLEELYMNNFKQWNAVDQTLQTNASLIELNNMKNLYTLHVSILDSSVIPEDLNIKKLTKYEIHIGEVWHRSSHKGSKTLMLKWDPISDIFQKECIQSILGKTDNMVLDRLDGIEQSICALSQKGFLELKHLCIKNSPSVHYILQSLSHTNFKMLESLLLENLINLEKICTNNISSKSFSALKVVRVECCHKMEVLFPLSSVRELPQLEKIKIVNCMSMRGILEVDENGKFELRNLHALKLRYLPKIKNFFTIGSAPSSSTSDDPVATQIAFFNGQQVAFQRLETLEISGFDNLGFIFFLSMFKSLTQLKKLTVSDCEKTETIIMEEEGLGTETSEILAFPTLTHLHLERLKSLTCFSCGKCKIDILFLSQKIVL